MHYIDPEIIRELAPHAIGEYVAGFAQADDVLSKYDINNRLRICHFFAQVLAETGGFRVFRESLYYSALRLTKVWPRHFRSLAAAEPYAHSEEKLGNYIYGPAIHPDLGNTEPGDGFRFRGRGLLQITGRAAYQKYGALLNISLLDDPDLAFDHRYSLSIAAAEFSMGKHNGKSVLRLCDEDDLVGVTYAVNGGQNGIEDRRFYLERATRVFRSDGDGAAVAFAGEAVSRAIANTDRAASA